MTIMQNRNNRRLGFTLIELMLVVAIIAILAAILTPSFLKARAQAQLTACKSNVKNIGTACEMFAIDRKGRYPEQLAFLTLGAQSCYLKMIPTCPAVGSDTYTASYTFTQNPDCFTVRCGGANHIALNVPAGYPLYDSVVGLACTGEPGEAVASAGGSDSGGSGSDSGSGSGSDSGSDSGSGSGSGSSGDSGNVASGSGSSGPSADELAAQQKAAEEAAERATKIATGKQILSKCPKVSYSNILSSYAFGSISSPYKADADAVAKVQQYQNLMTALASIGVQSSVQGGYVRYEVTADDQFVAAANSEAVQSALAMSNNYDTNSW